MNSPAEVLTTLDLIVTVGSKPPFTVKFGTDSGIPAVMGVDNTVGSLKPTLIYRQQCRFLAPPGSVQLNNTAGS